MQSGAWRRHRWRGLAARWARFAGRSKDPAQNGDLDPAALLKHVSENKLVGWAWAPGGKRMLAPGTQVGFGALMQAWFESGAVCPAE